MEITKKEITLCSKCNNWKGVVEEKYNGLVPVHCACTLSTSQQNGWKVPQKFDTFSMYSYNMNI